MTPRSEPLPFGATIGILGGGQLGRMSAHAAARLGYRTHIFTPEAGSPGGEVASAVTENVKKIAERVEAARSGKSTAAPAKTATPATKPAAKPASKKTSSATPATDAKK